MNLFQRRDCQVTIYTLAAMRKYGQEALEWDPLILRDAFQRDFSCKLSKRAFDKLMAGTSMIGTNLFTSSIQSFLACTAACANKPISQNKLSYASLQDCCWSVFVYKDLIGYDQQQVQDPFDMDIIMYIQALMDQHGISKLPKYMEFADFNTQKKSAIQQSLVQDVTAFQAYNKRQLNQVADINAYVAQKQKNMIQQLKQLQKIFFNLRLE